MRYRLLEFLRCPACEGHLSLSNAVERTHTDVSDGSFNECTDCAFSGSIHFPAASTDTKCSACWHVEVVSADLNCQLCSAHFPVIDGVPRMLPERDILRKEELGEVKEHTQKNFGFEWQFYARHGWDYGTDKIYDPNRFEVEKDNFVRKALVLPEEFASGLVLDAGCGNGRYSLQSHALGAEVVGMDLSIAVDAAAANLADHPDVHIVQGDIFNPPFARNTFDRVFSLGVLMHTGNARRAFESLLRFVKPGGLISIHLYSKGNAIYEFVDRVLRKRTIHMDLQKLLRHSNRGARFARMVYNTRWITRGRPLLYELMNCFIRLEMAEHNVFDWYSAPVASHHTYPDTHRWFRDNEIEITADNNRKKPWPVRLLSSVAGGVGVKGRKRSAIRTTHPGRALSSTRD